MSIKIFRNVWVCKARNCVVWCLHGTGTKNIALKNFIENYQKILSRTKPDFQNPLYVLAPSGNFPWDARSFQLPTWCNCCWILLRKFQGNLLPSQHECRLLEYQISARQKMSQMSWIPPTICWTSGANSACTSSDCCFPVPANKELNFACSNTLKNGSFQPRTLPVGSTGRSVPFA